MRPQLIIRALGLLLLFPLSLVSAQPSALVMAQGRQPASDLAPLLRRAGVACAAIGDAHAIGRIGDAVHAAHHAVRRLVVETQPGTSHAESA